MAPDQLPLGGEAVLAAEAAGTAHPGFLEALGVAAYTTDAEGRLTAYNAAAVALWGWNPPLGDARWCGSWRLFQPDGTPLDHADCPMALAIRQKRPVRDMEAAAERPDGTRVPFIAYPAPLFDPAGNLVGAVNVLVDITDRKAAEAALAASEARLRTVFDTTPEWITIVASDGTLLQTNPAGLRVIEADSPMQVIGGSAFPLIAPEFRAAWRANHERVCAGESLRWEFDIIGRQGTRRSMETHATPLTLPKGQCAHLAITRDVTARKQAEERQALLLREVDHRAKNALAVALSLVRLTRAEDPRCFAEAVEGRIAALARAHSLLAEQRWSGAELRAVIQAELTPGIAAGRVDLRGPPVWLAPGAVQPMAVVLHELSANAATYGALSAPAGRVSVSWNLAPAGGGLVLRWTESGGPEVAEPQRRGLGSKLIEGTVRGQLGGTVRKDWGPDGLRCEIGLGADQVQRHATRAEQPEATDGTPLPTAQILPGNRVLIRRK